MTDNRPPIWQELLLTTFTLAGTALLIWSQMPPQEREWIRLAVMERARRMERGLSVRARLAGRAGMAEELAGRDPSPFYSMALTLSRWRDRARKAGSR